MYINPQGIRMLRGFVDYADVPERRYYIESPGGLLVMRMTEDERYYHTADCEQVLLETADSIRRK